MDDLKQYVINNVNPETYYQSIFPEWNPKNKPNQICPWHDDTRPSLSIALDKGGARCHACEKRLGNIVHFEAEKENINEYDAAKQLYSRFIHKLFPKATFRQYQSTFNGKHSEWIAKDCGLTGKSIERFNLGFDESSRRLTIPIKDRFGSLTNIRYYCLPRHRTDDTQVKIYNAKDHGYLELFPWQEILKYTPSKPIFMMKAEKDTMLAIQDGLQAFCVTNGELAWSGEWDELFKEYEIGICLDKDETGIKATEKKLAILQGNCKSVVSIDLPFTSKSKELKDYADWRLLDGGTASALLHLHKSTRDNLYKLDKKLSLPSVPSLPEYYSNDYQEIIDIGRNSDMLNLIVKVKGIVSAKSDKTYTIPYKFLIGSSATPKRSWSIPIGRELLRLTKSSDDGIIEFIRKDLLGKDDNAGRFTIEPQEYITATEVEIIPVAGIDSDAPYTIQKCFYFGKHIDANVPYHLDIIPTTDIRTQETIGIIVNFSSISSSIDKFIFSKETLHELEEFRIEEGKSWEGLKEFTSQLAAQFTPIRGRLDWHIVALLTWSSPLQFEFPNEGLQRGWLNTLALGDTETGKSKVIQAYKALFNCGVFVNAENCTYVGLVGGAIKSGSGAFMLRWGRIPLCNRQLVAIEELSGLSVDQISNMSEVRSSGIARLDKGGLSAETSSKTRLLCLSNVRGLRKSLADYTNGVTAIQELIGHGEDIARFDLICTLTNKEVPAHVINQNLFEQETFAILQKDKLQKLMQFIWALKPNQIQITKDTYLHCLDVTQELGKKYHPSCHIFQSASGRLKLARIACAVAALQFSWNGDKIIVKREHIDAASNLLQMLYDKESFGYKEYSEQIFYRDNIRAVDYLNASWLNAFNSTEKQRSVVSYMLMSGKFSAEELTQVGGTNRQQADNFIGRFIASNGLRKGEANVWEITPIGYGWLQTKKPKDEKGFGVRKLEKPTKGIAAALRRKA